MRHSMSPDEGVLHNETDRGHFGKDVDSNHEHSLSDDASSDHSAQAGVKRIEAVSKAWTKTSLIVAYVRYVQLDDTPPCSSTKANFSLLLIANVTSLEIQVTGIMTRYATSSFALHSLLSTIYVVQGVVSGKHWYE
jgi:SP family sugar:H+ symporter-like MFS transporter